jgi:hypothetical protein
VQFETLPLRSEKASFNRAFPRLKSSEKPRDPYHICRISFSISISYIPRVEVFTCIEQEKLLAAFIRDIYQLLPTLSTQLWLT